MTDTEQSELPTGIEPGSIIANKYRVERVIGSGGMGVVVKATHLELREAVAIKVLLPELSQHPEAATRFLREARAAAKLRNVHVARTTDVGALDNGQRYMVMEYLQGSDLASILLESGRLSVRRALTYVLQVCDALAEAHQQGIIHRDIKPANLFLVSQSDGPGVVKVLDFGVSKAIDLQSTRNIGKLTRSQTMVGTPVYASPEQLLSAADVDERTDIWALGGVVLYELLTGRPPFLGDSIEELVSRVLASAPEPLRTIRPDVPAAVEHIVMTCLQKERHLRYASAAELVNAILAVSGTDLDAESQLMGSRIVRRHNSSKPPPPMVPVADVKVLDAAPGASMVAAFGRAPTPLKQFSSDLTKVSPQSNLIGEPSGSTNAGVYSSRPVTPVPQRRFSKRVVGFTILGFGIVVGGLLIGLRWPAVPKAVPSAAASSVLGSAVSLPVSVVPTPPPAISVLNAPSAAPSVHSVLILPVQAVAPDSKAPVGPKQQTADDITAPNDNSIPSARVSTPTSHNPKLHPSVSNLTIDRQGNSETTQTTQQPSRTIVDFGPRR